MTTGHLRLFVYLRSSLTIYAENPFSIVHQDEKPVPKSMMDGSMWVFILLKLNVDFIFSCFNLNKVSVSAADSGVGSGGRDTSAAIDRARLNDCRRRLLLDLS